MAGIGGKSSAAREIAPDAQVDAPPGPPTPDAAKKKKRGLKSAVFKALGEDLSMLSKAAKKGGKAISSTTVKTAALADQATQLFLASGPHQMLNDDESPVGLLDPHVIGAEDSRFWDDGDEPPEEEKDDANWDGLEGFQSTPDQSDSEPGDRRRAVLESRKADACPDEKEPEEPAKGEAAARGELASSMATPDPGKAPPEDARRKKKGDDGGPKKWTDRAREARAKMIEWDAKKFGHVRPLQCQSIWDIPTSKEPAPEKVALSETYLQAIGKAEKKSPKAAPPKAAASPIALERGEAAAIRVRTCTTLEPAWYDVPKLIGLARAVVLGCLVIGALVTVMVLLVK
mmetsp:Transcript_51841/g.136944  ORF Transcript_51841/g.136944 Transcript_51841/m.136944 type:complete len:344 (-) Transcript_51841:136-1167(-)